MAPKVGVPRHMIVTTRFEKLRDIPCVFSLAGTGGSGDASAGAAPGGADDEAMVDVEVRRLVIQCSFNYDGVMGRQWQIGLYSPWPASN